MLPGWLRGNRYYVMLGDSDGGCVHCQAGKTHFKMSISRFGVGSPMTLVYQNTLCGLNYCMGQCVIHGRWSGADCQLSSSPPGPWTINITCIPPNATILQAYLVYSVINCNSTGLPENFTITNPSSNLYSYTSANLAHTFIDPQYSTCWEGNKNAIYNVTCCTQYNGKNVFSIF